MVFSKEKILMGLNRTGSDSETSKRLYVKINKPFLPKTTGRIISKSNLEILPLTNPL